MFDNNSDQWHVSDSTEVQYSVIIVSDILMPLGIGVKIFNNRIVCEEQTFQKFTSPIMSLDDYYFQPLHGRLRAFLGIIFIISYVRKCYEPKTVCSATKILRTMIDAKYENLD